MKNIRIIRFLFACIVICCAVCVPGLCFAQSTTPLTSDGAFPLLTAQSIIEASKESPLVHWDSITDNKLEANYGPAKALDLSEGGTRGTLILSADILPEVAQPSLTIFSGNGASEWMWYPGAKQIGGNYIVPFDQLVPISGSGADVTAVERVVYEGGSAKYGDVVIKASSNLSTFMTDTLVVPDGDYATGDVVHFQLALTNIGGSDIFDVVFTDTPTSGYSLIPGSVTTTQGTVVSGNTPGDTTININVGFISTPPCHVGFVNIGFDLVIAMDDTLLQVCNQGTVTAVGINTPTDDASTPTIDDDNCSPLLTDTVGPAITITGGSPTFVECNAVYTDAGATAFDGRDGDVSGDVVVSGLPIDTSTPGDQFVTYDVEDSLGNTSQAIRTVTVQDTTAPTALCQDITVQLDGSGIATILPSDVDNGSSDTCGGVTLSLSQNTFTCADVGTTVVTLTVTDDASNTATCFPTVTVEDALGVCPLNFCTSANVAIPDANVIGVSSSEIILQSALIADLNISVLGTHTWVGDLIFTLTHVETGTSVTFIDRPRAPALGAAGTNNNDFNVTIDDEGAGGVVEDLGDAISTNLWPTSPPSYTPNNPLSAFDGENIQGEWRLTVSDNAGTDTGILNNWCLLITLDLPPVALCQDITVSLDAFGDASITAAQVDAGSSDVGGIQSITVSPDTFDCTDLGSNLVTLMVTDTAGQQSTCNATVTVEDNTAPVITLTGTDVTIECGSNYSDAGATASDACDALVGGITVGGPTVDSSTPPGDYVITYDVTDASGNAAVQVTRTVTVRDTTAPVIAMNGNATLSISCGSVYTDEGATASDTCDGDLTASITTVNPVDTNTPGLYDVTYDVSDNSSIAAVQATRTVTVLNDCVLDSIHSADQNGNKIISLTELLRVIQFFNIGAFHCQAGSEDGYNPNVGDQTCAPHDSDYNTQNWIINLAELLRLIQFFNVGAYNYCPGFGEDDFCPGP